MELVFKIIDLERTLPSGVVYAIHYIVELKEDKELLIDAFGMENVSGDPNRNDFIPFEELNEEKIIEWLMDKLGEEKILEIQTKMEQELEFRRNPKSSKGLPW